MDIRRLPIAVGLVLAAAGVLWPWLMRVGLGRLPGGIAIRKQNFSFHFPVITCLAIGAVLTLLFWRFRK